jgi:hypothetical protein
VEDTRPVSSPAVLFDTADDPRHVIARIVDRKIDLPDVSLTNAFLSVVNE